MMRMHPLQCMIGYIWLHMHMYIRSSWVPILPYKKYCKASLMITMIEYLRPILAIDAITILAS